MATKSQIDLIYCANGNPRFAQIAIEAGYKYGACVPGTVHYDLYFCDQDWKNPNRIQYMMALEKYQPNMATVVDWTGDVLLSDVICWAEEAAQFTEVIVIIPKVIGGVSSLPRMIGGKEVRLGYSVPTKYGGTEVPIWEFLDWPIHLLGGSPQKQFMLSKYLNVVSLDGNMAHKMATQYCAFFDPKKITERGIWPTLKDAEGKRWGDKSDKSDAPYEAFYRSCESIRKMWQG